MTFKQVAKIWFRRAAVSALVLGLVVGGYMGYQFYRSAATLAGTSNPIKLASSFVPSELNTVNGRVNILLAGYSTDDAGHQGAELTDSIMIASINTSTKQVTLISIPRDLYVNIPGHGYSKINAAYEDGYAETGTTAGGMDLLEETLTNDFGVQFSYYSLLNYTAFKQAVDDVGGVTITINSSDPRGVYDSNTGIDLPNGSVTLNGTQALALARSRGDGKVTYGFSSGDFTRTQYQQEILEAVLAKAGSLSTLTNPLKVGSLANAFTSNVKTDMTIGEIETLATKMHGFSSSNVTSVTLNNYQGTDYLTDYYTSSGQDALIPKAGIDDYSALQSLIQSLL